MGMAERIKERRKAMGYTQTELGEKLGLQASAIAKYENGRVKNMKRSVIANMANALECSPTYLMGLDNKEQEKEEPPKIMQYYELLNDIGKHEATKRVMELTEVPRYSKEDTEFSAELAPDKDYLKPQAAHNDNESEEQIALMQEDMSILKRPN